MTKLLTRITLIHRRIAAFGAMALVFVTGLAHAQGSGTAWIDFRLEDGQIRIPSEIGGVRGYTMLDTGATINGINQNFLDQNDLHFPSAGDISIQGIYGEESRNVLREVPVTIFGNTLDFSDLVSLNFGAPEHQLILGAGFMQLFIVQIDYVNNRMRLITRDSLDLGKLSNVKSMRDPVTTQPLIQVVLNGDEKAWLILDTGNNSGMLLERRVAERNDWFDKYETVDTSTRGVTRSGDMQRFRIEKVDVAGYEILDPLVSVPTEDSGILAMFERQVSVGTKLGKRTKAKGLLGYDILQHFVMTIDYRKGDVHLAAGTPLEE